MEEELYRNLDEDSRKQMICKVARGRDDDSKDVKGAIVIKHKNGKQLREM